MDIREEEKEIFFPKSARSQEMEERQLRQKSLSRNGQFRPRSIAGQE